MSKTTSVIRNFLCIFRLDARDDLQGPPVEWIDEKILGERVVFRRNENPAILMFNQVERDDENIYYCRADFEHTPTRNIKVNLTVTSKFLCSPIQENEISIELWRLSKSKANKN